LRRAPPRDQVHQQPMQPVDGLGAGSHQVLAPLGQQVQHHCLVLDADLPQGGDVAGRDRHRDRVVGVALAAMADRQHPHPGGQLGRHVHHVLAVADQPLGQRPADPVGTLDRPAALRPTLRPYPQGLVAVQGGRDALLPEQLAVLIQHGGGVGGLMGGRRRSSPAWEVPFSRADKDTRRAGRLGQGQSSVEPLPVGRRQDRTTVLEPTQAERQWRLWSDLPAPWNPTVQTQGSYPHSISRRRVVEVPALRNEVSPSRHWPSCWIRWVTATRMSPQRCRLGEAQLGSSTRLPTMVVWLSAAMLMCSFVLGG
jgi:hypothetical protein